MTRPRRIVVIPALLGSGAVWAVNPGALPQGPQVTGGKATISSSGTTMQVQQSGERTLINWNSFDIGAGAQVNFVQPNAGALVVNRVNSATPAVIEGGLHANGQVWILDPNGVFFGRTAQVDAAGIVASTANVDDQAFMAGSNRLVMTGPDQGAVVNEGSISVATGGLAAFVAPTVRNSGTINATLGRVTLAAGDTYTLDLAGDGLVEIGLGATQAVVDQSGRIVDPGGTVTLTAKAAGALVDSVINMSGVIDASSATASGGEVVLAADDIDTGADARISVDGGGRGDGGAISAVAAQAGDYAGVFSARGGALGGDGGSIETSGSLVTVAPGAVIDASASHGAAGTWLMDPLDVTITSGSSGGLSGSSITAGAIEAALQSGASGTNVVITTDQAGSGSGDLVLAASITGVSSQAGLTLAGRHVYATGGSTVSLAGGGALTLDVNTVNTLSDVSGQPGNWIQDALGLIGSVPGGATVRLGAATYAGGVTISQPDVTLTGAPGATIQVADGTDGVHIQADGDAVENLLFTGPALGQNYLTYAWGAAISRGISVATDAAGFTISGNTIEAVRNGILVNGIGDSGSITGNLIDDTKSAVSVQYTDGSGIAITGNSQGQYGNEWGENLYLNGYWDGSSIHSNPYPGGTAPAAVQAALLADSGANAGWSVQDQAYTAANRTSVTVATTGSDGNQGSPLSPLLTLQAGIDAVVSGGAVYVDDGTYVIPSGQYVNVDKPLDLVGESESGVILDARAASTYGLRITAAGGPVSLSDFTLWGVTAAGGYGLKAEGSSGLTLSYITSQGAGKTQFDLNGVIGGTLDHLTADGSPVGDGPQTAGNGIAITDSQNITLTNSLTQDNAWGGLALYQANRATGYPYQETGITVAASNTFRESNPVYAEDQSASWDFGTLNIAGFSYVAKSTADPGDAYTWFQPTLQAAVNYAAAVAPGSAVVEGYAGSGVAGNNVFTVGVSTTGTALSIGSALAASAPGATIDVLYGTYAEDVDVTAPRTISFDGATLKSFTLAPGAAGSQLSGSLTAGSVSFDAAAVLGGSLTLDTSAANGPISIAGLDGSVSGAQSLTLNAGSGLVTLGNLGATTRLGAVTDPGATVLSGATYDASSFSFGSATLTAATTTINTGSAAGAGPITFLGDIAGTSGGAQSLVLVAGNGTGAAAGNGDITLQDAGSTTLRLGALTVSGGDFQALTVDLSGDFTSQLTGNQVFAADTLDTLGAVHGTVGGDASGHVVAAGAVTLDVGGSLSGNITGSSLQLTAGVISGTFTGATVSMTASQMVTADVTAGTLNVQAPQGSVTGTWSNVTSGGAVSLNGQSSGGGPASTVNPRQLVVEGFVPPQDLRAADEAAPAVPADVLAGVAAPDDGMPRVVQVHGVQELGRLLASGHAVVVDLAAAGTR